MKKCKSCLEEKNEEEFSWKHKKENRRCPLCKICFAKQGEEKYNKNANEKKVCRICSIEKSLSEFGKDSSKGSGFRNECKDCKKVYNQNYASSRDGKLRHLLGDAKSHLNKRGIKNEPFTIRYEDLLDKWNKQKQKCYYSGMEMHHDSRKWQVSLERLDTAKGYTNENTALCCLEFNNQSQWSHEKIDDMIMNVEMSDMIKPISVGDISSKSSDMYYHLKRLFERCERRGEKNERIGSSDLSTQSLIELYDIQNGKCAYSGIPLRCGTSENSWIASLDRINPLIGYTKGNVCLTCLEFNTTDHTATYKETRDDETSGWNREKFGELYEQLKQTPRFAECIKKLPHFNTDLKLDVVQAKCVACNQDYNKKAKYTYRQKCEDCIKTHNFDQFERQKEKPLKEIPRVCTKCKEEYSLNDFSKSATSALGYNTICKNCKNERSTQLKEERRNR